VKNLYIVNCIWGRNLHQDTASRPSISFGGYSIDAFFCCVVFVGVSNLTRLYFFLSVFLFFKKICVLDSLADIDELLIMFINLILLFSITALM